MSLRNGWAGFIVSGSCCMYAILLVSAEDR
jgi:hypothetical protein